MRLILICAFAFITAGAAYGQLGQSEDATAKVFGKPLGAAKSASTVKILSYHTSAYDIIAGFKDGKAIYFIYKLNSGASWTPADVKAALSAHYPGADPGWYNYGSHWELYGHKNCQAEIHPAQKALVIWDSAGGMDPVTILDQNPL